MSNFQQLSSLIWNVADDVLRSLFKPHKYRDVLLPFVILRRLACVLEHVNPQIDIKIYGQELNPQTYSICKSDLLISGENPDHIRLGSSLGEDGFSGEKFDYMITNPPFGVSWKSEEEFVTAEAQNPNGRFFAGTPRTSDGSLLFLQHMIFKMVA